MRSQDIIAGRGGFKIAKDGVAIATADGYNFYGFVPHADITITNLVIGATDISSAVASTTFKQGIFYPIPSKVAPGYAKEITTSGGDACLYLTQDSPNHY